MIMMIIMIMMKMMMMMMIMMIRESLKMIPVSGGAIKLLSDRVRLASIMSHPWMDFFRGKTRERVFLFRHLVLNHPPHQEHPVIIF